MNSSSQTTATEPLALHELMSRILVTQPSRSQGISRLLPTAGTLQSWNQKLVQNSVADFFNSALRGVGQVI
ncbi:MAG: urea transporter, partial [Cyanobacteria bacterium P01_F01_bin.3]